MSVQKIIALGGVAVMVVFIIFLRMGDPDVSKPVAGPAAQPATGQQNVSKPVVVPPGQRTIKQAVSPSKQPANVTITTRQEVNRNSAPTAPSTQEQISKLLASAEKAMAKYRLTTPDGDNAHHYYDEVLALDPGNKDALAGLNEIVDHYRKMAMEALREGLLQEAEVYVDRGLTVQPDDPALLEIKSIW